MTYETQTQQNSAFDPEAFLIDVQRRIDGLSLVVSEGLARLRKATFTVKGETSDHTAYRHGQVVGHLSNLGKEVMLDLLKLGLTDEEVGMRMSVQPGGVAARRRKWGRHYGQKG